MIFFDFITGKNYYGMSWAKLSAEARKYKLDPRLTTIKLMEGAGEKDRAKIIEQLSVKDSLKVSRIGIWLSIIAILVSVIALFKT